MCRHHKAAFLLGAIHIRRDFEAVPVDKFGRVGVVEEIHRGGDALAKADQRARHRPVVSDGIDGAARCDLDLHWRDAQRDVRRPVRADIIGVAFAAPVNPRRTSRPAGARNAGQEITPCFVGFMHGEQPPRTMAASAVRHAAGTARNRWTEQRPLLVDLLRQVIAQADLVDDVELAFEVVHVMIFISEDLVE